MFEAFLVVFALGASFGWCIGLHVAGKDCQASLKYKQDLIDAFIAWGKREK